MKALFIIALLLTTGCVTVGVVPYEKTEQERIIDRNDKTLSLPLNPRIEK
jgi:hypothetical protein